MRVDPGALVPLNDSFNPTYIFVNNPFIQLSPINHLSVPFVCPWDHKQYSAELFSLRECQILFQVNEVSSIVIGMGVAKLSKENHFYQPGVIDSIHFLRTKGGIA